MDGSHDGSQNPQSEDLGTAGATTEFKTLLAAPGKDVDLGCGGCTHWLAIDDGSAGESE